MKKAFTLIEIVIVILIIWILFWAIWYLSWSYVYKLNIQSDQETIINTFRKVQSMSLSQPIYKNKVLSYIWVKLIPHKKYILEIGSTGTVENYFSVGAKPLYYLSMWTWFTVVSGANKISISWSWQVFYKSYWLGAYFVSNWNIYSGNKIIKFKFLDKSWEKAVCFKLNLISWRVFVSRCE